MDHLESVTYNAAMIEWLLDRRSRDEQEKEGQGLGIAMNGRRYTANEMIITQLNYSL